MLPRPLYFQPLGAVSQYPAFQELAALCLLFSHGLGLTLELIFALQVQWRKLNEDTQGPKGLISWNSEMKARGSQSVTLSASCHVNTACFFLWCLGSIKGQQPGGGMETSRWTEPSRAPQKTGALAKQSTRQKATNENGGLWDRQDSMWWLYKRDFHLIKELKPGPRILEPEETGWKGVKASLCFFFFPHKNCFYFFTV